MWTHTRISWEISWCGEISVVSSLWVRPRKVSLFSSVSCPCRAYWQFLQLLEREIWVRERAYDIHPRCLHFVLGGGLCIVARNIIGTESLQDWLCIQSLYSALRRTTYDNPYPPQWSPPIGVVPFLTSSRTSCLSWLNMIFCSSWLSNGTRSNHTGKNYTTTKLFCFSLGFTRSNSLFVIQTPRTLGMISSLRLAQVTL